MEHHQEEENVLWHEKATEGKLPGWTELERSSAWGSRSQAFDNSSSKSNSHERDKLVLNQGCVLYQLQDACSSLLHGEKQIHCSWCYSNVLSYQMTQKEKHFYFSVTLSSISISVSSKIQVLKSFAQPEQTTGVAWPSVRSPVPGDTQRGEQGHSKHSHTAHPCPPPRRGASPAPWGQVCREEDLALHTCLGVLSWNRQDCFFAHRKG